MILHREVPFPNSIHQPSNESVSSSGVSSDSLEDLVLSSVLILSHDPLRFYPLILIFFPIIPQITSHSLTSRLGLCLISQKSAKYLAISTQEAKPNQEAEEQYTDLLEPIPEPQLVLQNDNHVTFVAPSMVHSGGIVETTSAPNEEIHAHRETVYRNLVNQVAHVNRVNSNMRATNVELKSELARYKIQEQRVEISQEKYDKLEKCYQKSVYQEQCLTRKINDLHLSSAK
uniref:Uncharacterized protein n=1 Tax=Tanacetum cinerariifolium TaxID=118510 RepID=A0A699I2K2_TANCI|nr:hypothetical protein [Tanacetum cinerariifolium]